MSTLAEIEAAVAALSPEELAHLETFLREQRAQHSTQPDLAELAHCNGFDPFPRRSTGTAATTELVRQICEEEGI